jgi:hypothetical protein
VLRVHIAGVLLRLMKSVIRVRAGYRPVMMLDRLGLHTGHVEYALVNFIPVAANRSRLGVGPKSSATSNTKFGGDAVKSIRATPINTRKHNTKRIAAPETF